MLILSSISAGACIGLGCWLYVSAPNSLIGALLFSCGLLAIRLMKYNLFTGKIQFMCTKQYKISKYISILLFNLIGILLMFILSSSQIREAAANIGQIKMHQSLCESFVKAIGCGALMTIATYKDTPLYITILCVFSFITAGFNHCIADAFYFLAVNQLNWNWVTILFGNILGGLMISPYLNRTN